MCKIVAITIFSTKTLSHFDISTHHETTNVTVQEANSVFHLSKQCAKRVPAGVFL